MAIAAAIKPGASVAVGIHHEPRIPGQHGPMHLKTAEGLIGSPKGYTSIEKAEHDASSDDPDEAGVAIVQFGKKFYLQAVQGVNNIGSSVAYTPDKYVDYGELNVKITNPDVKKIVDGWTEITPDMPAPKTSAAREEDEPGDMDSPGGGGYASGRGGSWEPGGFAGNYGGGGFGGSFPGFAG